MSTEQHSEQHSEQHIKNLSQNFVGTFRFLNHLIQLELAKIPASQGGLERVKESQTLIEEKSEMCRAKVGDEGATIFGLQAKLIDNLAADHQRELEPSRKKETELKRQEKACENKIKIILAMLGNFISGLSERPLQDLEKRLIDAKNEYIREQESKLKFMVKSKGSLEEEGRKDSEFKGLKNAHDRDESLEKVLSMFPNDFIKALKHRIENELKGEGQLGPDLERYKAALETTKKDCVEQEYNELLETIQQLQTRLTNAELMPHWEIFQAVERNKANSSNLSLMRSAI